MSHILPSHINPSIKSYLSDDLIQEKPLHYYVNGITTDLDYYVLSEAITLLESDQTDHHKKSLEILAACYPSRSPSIRIGITGSPGVGKSTFIDSIAAHFVDQKHRVGILTIDPSSTSGKGSILGDKTRMERLSKIPSIFIRPSPTNRHLGGLNKYTYESMILCEAAQMDRILVETVGVGQSEVAVSDHTDFTIMLILPGSGDSLQGIKKGILEKADMIIIHKSDGDSVSLAKQSVKAYQEAMHLRRSGEEIPILHYSSITEASKEILLIEIEKIIADKMSTLDQRRKDQEQRWISEAIERQLTSQLLSSVDMDQLHVQLKAKVAHPTPFNILTCLQDHYRVTLSSK
jgi:LAO/AO transport system kinase